MTVMLDSNDPNYVHTCTKCLIPKPNSEYSRSYGQRRKRTYASRCKACDKGNVKRWVTNNPEKRKEIARRWNANNPEKRAAAAKSSKLKNPVPYMTNTAKGNALKRGLEFDITPEDVEKQFEVQGGLCYYTRDPLNRILMNEDSMSIDRVDSSIGYVVSNIVLCKAKVNVMKNNASVEELIDFCEKVLRNKENL